MGTGSFTGTFTNLLPLTTYYVRAYATNTEGTSYGSQVSFTSVQAFNAIEFNNSLTYGTVQDIEGNPYKTIQIGTQMWMAENLKTTRFNNGTAILNLTSDTEWDAEDGSVGHTDAAYCWYDNNEAICKSIFGALYNWNAVNTGNLCPTNWHVPTSTEWMTLITYLGGINIAGNELKETGVSHWPSPNDGADNATGFTALAGGFRMPGALCAWIGFTGFWWSSSEGGITEAWNINLNPGSGYVGTGNNPKKNGFSVRCVTNLLFATLTTKSVSNITTASVESGGNITSDGGTTITSRGVCWSTLSNPTTSDNHTVDGSGTGSFTSSITGLTANTNYYVRAYATNGIGTAYGDQISFKTPKDYQLEYVSGNNQTYPGGGIPLPLVFRIKNVSDAVYITDIDAENLSMGATAPTGYQDAAFNNLNDYCGEGVNSSCYGGYYYVEPNTGSSYVLSLTVTLKVAGQNVSTFLITENIMGNSLMVTNTADNGAGSLRDALIYANSTIGSKGNHYF